MLSSTAVERVARPSTCREEAEELLPGLVTAPSSAKFGKKFGKTSLEPELSGDP
jgi:hypothetical protein